MPDFALSVVLDESQADRLTDRQKCTRGQTESHACVQAMHMDGDEESDRNNQKDTHGRRTEKHIHTDDRKTHSHLKTETHIKTERHINRDKYIHAHGRAD